MVTFSWLPEFDNGVDTFQVVVYRNSGSAGWQQYAGPFAVSGNPRQVTVNATGFSSWTIGSANNPLPVEVTEFTATPSARNVTLHWSTATEINSAYFEIQRRAIGSSAWTVIGKVKAAGNSNAPKHYTFTDNNVLGSCAYQLKQVDNNGSSKIVGSVEVVIAVPKVFMLSQNYPNPFNPSTELQFTLEKDGYTSLKVYNLLGQEVATLFDGNAVAGQLYEQTWSASKFPSGTYFARLESANKTMMRKLVLMK